MAYTAHWLFAPALELFVAKPTSGDNLQINVVYICLADQLQGFKYKVHSNARKWPAGKLITSNYAHIKLSFSDIVERR